MAEPGSRPGSRRITLDLDEIMERALGALPEQVTIFEPEADDRLSDEEIRDVLCGKVDKARKEVRQSAEELREHGIDKIIERAIPDQLERLAIRVDKELYPELCAAIEEREDRDPFEVMLDQTQHLLLRYDLGQEVEPPSNEHETLLEARAAARAAGISFTRNREAFTDLVTRSDGGDLAVLWYGDPRPLLREAVRQADGDGGWLELGWTDPQLVVMNQNGGDACARGVVGTVVRRFEHDRCFLDADKDRDGYSFSDVHGAHRLDYATRLVVHSVPQLEAGGRGVI